jgi:hypothetical protein
MVRIMAICLTLLLLAYTYCAGQGVQIQSLPAPKPSEIAKHAEGARAECLCPCILRCARANLRQPNF